MSRNEQQLLLVQGSNDRFAIFHFSDESVEIVSFSWITSSEKTCWFPNVFVPSKIKKLVKNHAPVVSADFTEYSGRVLGKYATYDEAKEMLPHALRESDLEGKVKVRPKATSSFAPELPPPPISRSTTTLKAQSGNSDTVPGGSLPKPRAVSETSEVQPSVSYFSSSFIAGGGQDILLVDGTGGNAACSVECNEFRQDVLRKLEEIQETQKSQSEMLRSILVHIQNGKPTRNEFELPRGLLPLKTMEDAQQFDSLLISDSVAYEAMVSRFRTDGGGSTELALKSILKSTFLDDLLCMHNYRGQSGKKSFLDYTGIIGVFIDSIKDNVRVTDYSRGTFDKVFQLLLKQTCDRVRERKKKSAATRKPEKSTEGPSSSKQMRIQRTDTASEEDINSD